MTTIMTIVIFLSLFITLCNIKHFIAGSHDVQQRQSGIDLRHNSVIKCAIDNIDGDEMESKCGLCVRWDKTKGNSVYMERKSQNESCPGPEPTGKGKMSPNGLRRKWRTYTYSTIFFIVNCV